MTRMLPVCLLAVSLSAAPVFAQKSAKAPAPQSYDATFVMNGKTYTGTMMLKIAGSKVSGTMAITDPATVNGAVAGTLEKGALALDYSFTVEGDQPCTGRVVINAKMAPDRSTASGHAETTGCGDDAGDFTIKKSAAKSK